MTTLEPAVRHLPATLMVRSVPGDGTGYDARSDYVELFWLPTLGPTPTWLLRRLRALTEGYAGEIDVDTAELAASIGIPGPAKKLRHALDRLAAFNLGWWETDGSFAAVRRVPALSRKAAERLPKPLFEAWQAERDKLS